MKRGPPRAAFTTSLQLARLPAVPPAALSTRSRGTQDKTEQPHRENDDRDNPKGLEGESGTEKKQCEKKNEEQRNHIYQPPSPHVPRPVPPTRRKMMFLGPDAGHSPGRPPRSGAYGACGVTRPGHAARGACRDSAG
ncbi:hypothetical protein Stsp01_14520 [Streptomyces sp. NBRC 13847]|nr:hypothetical protein Stsp01_14520 [Streptomyces sp. NBRC 13847]